jgi:hypothetical protein
MKSILIQYSTSEQKDILDLAASINKPYADKFGMEYLTSDVRRCPDRSIYWEKILYIQELLNSTQEGDLLVWTDADSLIVGDEDMKNVLPEGRVFGMVQMRGGLNCSRLIPWYNAGFIAMINCPAVKGFIQRVWDRNDAHDEASLNAELKQSDLEIGNGYFMTGLDIKWNCWPNNIHLCPNPVVRSFHGINSDSKLEAMKEYLKIKS